jgi:hypothetical protein
VASGVEAEGRVVVGHQGGVGHDAVDPAVQSDDEVEQAGRVTSGEQQSDGGDEDQDPDEPAAEGDHRAEAAEVAAMMEDLRAPG